MQFGFFQTFSKHANQTSCQLQLLEYQTATHSETVALLHGFGCHGNQVGYAGNDAMVMEHQRVIATALSSSSRFSTGQLLTIAYQMLCSSSQRQDAISPFL